jgi:hypothetical protein
VGVYAFWNAGLAVANKNNKRKIERNYLQSNSQFAPQLTPLDINAGNYLKFGYKDENGNYKDWTFVTIEFGMCHGMTMALRQFLYFAKFDPKSAKNKISPKAMKRKIDKVFRNQNVVFKGYKNLAELSTSIYGRYIQKHVADQWGIHTSKLDSYQNLYLENFKALTKQTTISLHKSLSQFLKKKFYPRVVLGPPKYEIKNPHVVMITDIQELKTKDQKTCFVFSYYNVGSRYGGGFDVARYCQGDYIYLPRDEKYYYYDFIQKSKRKRVQPVFKALAN